MKDIAISDILIEQNVVILPQEVPNTKKSYVPQEMKSNNLSLLSMYKILISFICHRFRHTYFKLRSENKFEK